MNTRPAVGYIVHGLFLIIILVFVRSNFHRNGSSRTTRDAKEARTETRKKREWFFFENKKTAEISSIFIRDVSAMRMAFSQTVQKLINEPVNILVFLTMLIIINFKLTIIILFTVPLSIFIIIKLGQSIRRKVKRSSEKIAGIMNVLNENIVGVKIVKSFTTENKELDRFQLENNRFYELIIKTERLRALITPINDMIGVTLGVFLLWIGGNEVLKSEKGYIERKVLSH